MKNIIKSTLFFLVVLIGCSKDSINNPDGTRLYKVSYQPIGFDSAIIHTIEYDMNDKPVRIQEIDKNSHVIDGYIEIEYDARGRFSGFTRQEDVFSFDYDQQGRIIRRYQKGIATNGQTQLAGEYSYDIRGQLISSHGFRFLYDDNGNVTEVRSPDFINTIGAMTSTVIYLNTYNTSPNAWDKIGLQMYFIFGDIFLLSKHNPVTSQYLSATNLEYTYEYYVSGYPKSITMKEIISGGGGFYGRIEYEYR